MCVYAYNKRGLLACMDECAGVGGLWGKCGLVCVSMSVAYVVVCFFLFVYYPCACRPLLVCDSKKTSVCVWGQPIIQCPGVL